MLWSVLGCIFFVLLGLGFAWVGILVVRATHTPPMSVAERWLTLSGFMTMGLGWVGFGLTFLRYAKGGNMRVPANAPLMDHITRIIGIVGLLGGAVLLFVSMLVRSAQRDRLYYEDPGDA